MDLYCVCVAILHSKPQCGKKYRQQQIHKTVFLMDYALFKPDYIKIDMNKPYSNFTTWTSKYFYTSVLTAFMRVGPGDYQYNQVKF